MIAHSALGKFPGRVNEVDEAKALKPETYYFIKMCKTSGKFCQAARDLMLHNYLMILRRMKVLFGFDIYSLWLIINIFC